MCLPVRARLPPVCRAGAGGAECLSAFLGGPMSGAPVAALADDVSAEELEIALVQEEYLLLDVYAS
eukprot:4268405-Prymnesium_polylepis.1